MSELLAGTARADISPPDGTPLAGYAWWRGSRGVRDPLFATALVLDDGATRLAIVALDLLAIHESVARAIAQAACERAGLSPDGLLLACSHSHCSPVASTSERAKPAQRAYVEALVPEVADAIVRAAATLAPVSLHAGATEASLAVHRRPLGPDGKALLQANPEGPVDRTMALLQLRDASGKAVATVVNVACHPTTLGPRHKHASAVWPGVMRAEVEARTGAPCLFLQGATGDLNPTHDWSTRAADLAAMEALGRRAAAAVLEALPALEPTPGLPLGCARSEVPLSLEPEPHPRTGRPMSYKQALWRRTHIPPVFADRLLDSFYPWEPAVTGADGASPTVPLTAQTLRLGEVAIATHGAETFQAIGVALRQRSPARLTLVAAYAGGMIGYLPTAEDHAHGGYEVDMSPYLYRLPGRLAPDSASRATDATIRHFDTLFPQQ
ncbi:MAG: neutral/alkaline non-lysosomal ceramidase N-terminal domain-containing protein [Deltaproteobacteria bacterium]|nr:neutral/alkaline non-lysosomal ceramidase N-terminal domain-containing protein [Deltaproteobacteria bacterium]